VQHPLLFEILKRYGVPDALVRVVQKMFEDCFVSCKLDNEEIHVKYNTGVQQGDNTSPVLFTFTMQAFLDTVKLGAKTSDFQFFKPPKNGNLKAWNGRLLGQLTSSKGTAFELSNILFVDDSVFLTENREELEALTPILIQHFKCLGMQMHIGNRDMKSKTEAMFFPGSLKEAKALTSTNTLPPNLTLPDDQHVQFTHCFKYLGSQTTTELNEDAKIRMYQKS
jgi:hypothetical protein